MLVGGAELVSPADGVGVADGGGAAEDVVADDGIAVADGVGVADWLIAAEAVDDAFELDGRSKPVQSFWSTAAFTAEGAGFAAAAWAGFA